MFSPNLLLFLAMVAVIFVVLLGAWLLVARAFTWRRQQAERRLGVEGDQGLVLLPRGHTGSGWAARFDTAFERVISRTGLNLDTPLAIAVILLGGVLLGGFVFIWRQDEDPWLALPAFVIGGLIPFGFFIWRNSVWKQTLRNQMPDTFYLLARALRAGRSLDQAFQLVGEQGLSPLKKEFARMHAQMGLGLSLAHVLETTARRLDLVDFNIFAAVLALHRPTGGNLPSALDRLAASTRERNQFDGAYRTATVLGRYSAGFILFMVGVILIYLFFYDRDAAMRFFESSTGVTLFVTALILELCGGALLFYFLRADY